MSTLFSIARELHLSLDELFAETSDGPPGGSTTRAAEAPSSSVEAIKQRMRESRSRRHIQRGNSRSAIDFESDVRWERLTPPEADHDVAFLYVVYDVGGSSSPDGSLMSHGGREWGLVLSGWLEVTVGSDTYELGPRDSIYFESTTPHRVRNIGAEPVHAVWFGVGRRADQRLHALHAAEQESTD